MKSKYFSDAFASVFDLSPSKRPAPTLDERYFLPSTGSDAESMSADFRAVGDDMRLALRQYARAR
jgi:hypothetical protein